MTPKSLIFVSFLVPGPFLEAPGAFLDVLRALPVASGTPQKLLNNEQIDFWTLLGALGTLLGALGAIFGHFESKIDPKWSQNGPKMIPK